MANQSGPPKEQGDQALLARVVMENLTGGGSLKVRILRVLLCVPFYLCYLLYACAPARLVPLTARRRFSASFRFARQMGRFRWRISLRWCCRKPC